MRATRSDSMILEDCRVPEEALLFRSDDIVPFRRDGANWFWGVLHARVPRDRRRRLPGDHREREGTNAARVLAAAGLSPGRPPARGGDERRPRGRAAGDAPLGLAQRHRGPDAGHPLGALSRQVHRRRGRDPRDAHRDDAGPRPRAVRDLAARALLATARSRPCSSPRATSAWRASACSSWDSTPATCSPR
jgi:hypothetical protein